MAQSGRLCQLNGYTVHSGYAQNGGDALEGGKRRYTHHDKHHQGLEVATADAHQGLAATTRGHHHAKAEHDAAHQRRQPDKAVRSVEYFVGLQQAGSGQTRKAQHGHTDGQAPNAHAGPVAHADNVAHRPHGAKMRALHDETEKARQAESGPQKL